MKCINIITTTSSKDEAEKISNYLIDKRLIACSQIEEIDSYYIWNDKKENNKEFRITTKTRKELFIDVYNEIKKIHSYKLPEIISIDIICSKKYENWIYENTKGGKLWI